MANPKENGNPWEYTKGMMLSYAALTSALINSGAVTSASIIEELDILINFFEKSRPDDLEVRGTLQLAKDAIFKMSPPDDPDSGDTLWFSDIIGNA
jgi:hypothetical protein